jgi:glutamate synthase (ferredoxin)
VDLEALSVDDLQEVKQMLQRHEAYTQSVRASQLLALWDDISHKFVKVMPKDFRRMLSAIQQAERDGLVGEEAVMIAFEANKNDVARVSGN